MGYRWLMLYRARVNPVASLKIKNNLLALTLVLTSLPGSVTVSKAAVEQVAYVIGQYLGAASDRPQVSSDASRLCYATADRIRSG